MPKGRKKPNSKKGIKKVSIYNRILRELTAIDKKLPQEYKISYKDRQKQASKIYQEKYKQLPKIKRYVKDIKKDVQRYYDKRKPDIDCNPNLLPINLYAAPIEWFLIDSHIREMLPKCIYIRVNAGNRGRTKIFNTRNYDYTRSGVRQIVDNLQDAKGFKGKSNNYLWSGYIKLKPNKPNNGTPENYFIDYVLHTPTGNALDATTETRFKGKPTASRKKLEKKIMEVISERRNKVKKTKQHKAQFRKQFPTKIKELNKLKGIIARSKGKKAANKAKFNSKYNSTLKKVEKELSNGYITNKQYSKYLQKLFSIKPHRK